ncbi:Appr-1-p processing protein [bacterium]|nr:MAG: Appr-1-p processing protein [bacterium]
MIKIVSGNLLGAEAEAVVNTVNCVGIMGKGIALQFKQTYPENFTAYERACKAQKVVPGKMFVFSTGRLVNPKYIINFPTKRHWKGKSKIEDIKRGLVALVEEVKTRSIRSIAIPPLGCGLGGLEWSEVKPLIENAFSNLDEVQVLLFAPGDAPKPDEIKINTKDPGMTRSRALFIKLIERYCAPGYQLTLLEIQKLAYFLQEGGEPLRLRFAKMKYGPYADNLNHVLQRLEGHYIRGYGDRSRKAQIHLLPDAVKIADAELAGDSTGTEHLDRVAALIEGFETPYGMELLSTVHWVCHESPSIASDLDKVRASIAAWNERKQNLFTPKHIQVALRRLHDVGWIESSQTVQVQDC